MIDIYIGVKHMIVT